MCDLPVHYLSSIPTRGQIWIYFKIKVMTIFPKLLGLISLTENNLNRPKKNTWSFSWSLLNKVIFALYCYNPKRKKSWVDPSQSSASQLVRNIYGNETLLYSWWDQNGAVYYEVINPGETITRDRSVVSEQSTAQHCCMRVFVLISHFLIFYSPIIGWHTSDGRLGILEFQIYLVFNFFDDRKRSKGVKECLLWLEAVVSIHIKSPVKSLHKIR